MNAQLQVETLRLKEFAARYQLFKSEHAEQFLGVSREAVRSQARRLKKKGLVTNREAVGGVPYWALTTRGRTLLGVPGRGPCSGRAIFGTLGITEFFSWADASLLTPGEITAAFEHLRKTADLELDVPGLQKSRFFWHSCEELSRVLVDMTLPNGFQAERYVKRIIKKRAALRSKSESWRMLIDQGGLSFTVLSPVDRSYELTRAADRAGLLLHAHAVPILANAWGVRCVA